MLTDIWFTPGYTFANFWCSPGLGWRGPGRTPVPKPPPPPPHPPGVGVGVGWGGSFKSDFNYSRSYHRLQVGFGGTCTTVHVGVVTNLDLSCLGARQFLDVKPPTHSATGEQKWITQMIILTTSRPVGCQAENHKPPSSYIFGGTRSGIKPWPPAPRADALTTMLRAIPFC